MKTRANHKGYCLTCGKESKKPFCNRECYLKYVAPAEHTCRNCGETYKPKSPERNTYCSRDCYFIAIVKAKAERPKGKKSIKIKQCKICGVLFRQNRGELYCSGECRRRRERDRYYADHDHYLKSAKERYINVERDRRLGARVYESKKCKWCGQSFVSEYGDGRRAYCSATCQARSERWSKHLSNWPGDYKRIKAERDGDRFKKTEIYDRDGWVCGICHRKVSPKNKYPHPLSASIDHILPIASGGTHTKDNVQLAHLSCNVLLGVGGVKQLRMFG